MSFTAGSVVWLGEGSVVWSDVEDGEEVSGVVVELPGADVVVLLASGAVVEESAPIVNV